LTIPVEALVLNGQQETVYVLDDSNHIHIRNVAVGLQGSKLAEITSGLKPGDRVVIGGQDKYQENEEVNPLQTSEPASETVQETGGMIDMKAETSNGDTH
jgi:multidrug efflux pump subunit AcrA (membrane-fusion protein)